MPHRPATSERATFLEALLDPVLVLARGIVLDANQPARALFPPGRGVGHPLVEVLPALRETVILKRLADVEAKHEPVRMVTGLSLGGRHGRFEMALAPLGDSVLLQIRPIGFSTDAGAQPNDEVRTTQALVDAGMALSSALSLDKLLQVLVDVARDLIQARFAAMGVINAEGNGLSNFITSGLTPEQRARMGDLPTGHGILGLVIRDARPIKLRNLSEHPASAGVPPHHPHMKSFLGVPVTSKGRVFGNLYLTEKLSAPEFSDTDVALLESLAAQAGVAIENAILRRERDRFFAAASHELGNAVTGVRVWARHLFNMPPESATEWLDGLRKISTGAEHAGRLIDDLLSLSRIGEGRLLLSAATVDLADVVNEAFSMMRPEAEAVGVRVSAQLPPGIIVDTDALRVRQIVVNLLANALKFSPAERVVTAEIAMDGDDALISVSDEGPGLTEDEARRIFEPYQQVATVARGRGTGLGLTLSRQLARLLGGELTVQSAPGAGARFTLRLPPVMPHSADE